MQEIPNETKETKELNIRTNVISFDIGIKNMCFCILKPEPFAVLDWSIVNLMEDPIEQKITVIPSCSQCNRKSKYQKRNVYYCKQHATKTTWLMPHKQYSKGSLKNKTKNDLLTFCHSKMYFLDTATKQPLSSMLKNEIVDSAADYFQDKQLESAVLPITSVSSIGKGGGGNAGNMDLIQIGRNLKKHLDKMPDSLLKTIGHVIIENQISTIATRMKTIQGMVTQYFIMRCNEYIHIEYISSSNKLKHFYSGSPISPKKRNRTDPKQPNPTSQTGILTQTLISIEGDGGVDLSGSLLSIPVKKETNYKKNKTDAILFCNQILDKYDSIKQEWGWTMQLPKKDDYADCFLQGVWYITKKTTVCI
jgi:hypothetical protein